MIPTFLNRKLFVNSALLFSMIMINTAANAKDPENFQSLMKVMGQKYSNVVLGILEDDYMKIMTNAKIIANHPEPPLSLRLRIIAKLGTDFTTFKSWDDKVHLSATALIKAAKQKNKTEILKHNAEMIKQCTGCHNAFRTLIKTLRE